jgi:hypothetical protein
MKINLFIIFLIYFAINVCLVINLSRKVHQSNNGGGELDQNKIKRDIKITSCLLIPLNVAPILFVIYLIMKNKVKMKNVNII